MTCDATGLIAKRNGYGRSAMHCKPAAASIRHDDTIQLTYRPAQLAKAAHCLVPKVDLLPLMSPQCDTHMLGLMLKAVRLPLVSS